MERLRIFSAPAASYVALNCTGISFSEVVTAPADGRWHSTGADTPPKAKAVTAHAATLLQNIYRSYDYRDKSDVYDALAYSVTGDLLEDLFLKIQYKTCKKYTKVDKSRQKLTKK